MKTKHTLFTIVFILTFQTLSAQTNDLTVKEQLEKLNKFWINKDFDDDILCENIQFNNRDYVSQKFKLMRARTRSAPCA